MRVLRDRLDGYAWVLRRKRAAESVEQADPRASILFVCTGNICRSPYAAERIRASGVPVEAASAGFVGPGRPPDPTGLAVARERGLDYPEHRSRRVTRELLDDAGLVLVFARAHLRKLRELDRAYAARAVLLGDLDPAWSGVRDIRDPWGGTEEEFREVFDRIDRCLDAVVEHLPPRR